MKTSEIRDNAIAILNVWQPELAIQMKDLTREQFVTTLDRLTRLLVEVEQKENELLALRNERDAVADELSNHGLRARAGVKSYFGDNSTEYELVGGTRSSDRKPRKATVKPAEPLRAAA